MGTNMGSMNLKRYFEEAKRLGQSEVDLLYFVASNIEFIPVGSATRQSEAKETSFKPDESYYLGTKKENPDLAIIETQLIIDSEHDHYLLLRVGWENDYATIATPKLNLQPILIMLKTRLAWSSSS
jgi:XisI protein